MGERKQEPVTDIALRLDKPSTPCTKEEKSSKLAVNEEHKNEQPQSAAQAKSTNNTIV